jgi:FtsP/CotA-like multicopper oxidase with cupredoxin domain
LAAIIAGSIVTYYLPSLNTPTNQPATTQRTACVKSPGDFLIIADLRGFNDSVDHLQNSSNEPWPVIRVNRGDRVNILVCNLDNDSPHGFAIQHYFDTGVPLMPHDSYRISFVADQDGTFTVYCNIFCPVHSYMQSGKLVVTG